MTSHLARQSRFTGGEIAPLSYGRTDSPAYQYGLRTAKNIICTLEGQAVNRPGTRYVCATRYGAASPSRLVSFSFTDGQNFILELSARILRFIKDGARVESSPGTPYEIATPWAEADIARLNFAQSGDVITVVHPSYPPYEIARIPNTNWTVTAVSYADQAYWGGTPWIAFDFTTIKGALGAAVSCSDSWDPNVTYSLGQFVVQSNGSFYKLYQSRSDGNLNNAPTGPGSFWYDCTWTNVAPHNGPFAKGAYIWVGTSLAPSDAQIYISLADHNTEKPAGITAYWTPASDSTRPPRKTQFVITQVYRDSLGVIHETLGSTPSPATLISIYDDRPAKVRWAHDVSAAPASFIFLNYRVYCGENGIYGFVGTTPYAPTPITVGAPTPQDQDVIEFVYDGSAPDFGVQPPRGENPFDVATGTNTKTQSYPGAFTYHEQRAVYARSNLRPQDFWGSFIADYKRFDVNTPVQDSDAFNFKPQSESLEEIRSLLSLEQLLLFTSNGVFNADGVNGPLTASSVLLRRSSNLGASYLRPLIADEAALYVTINDRVRDLQYDWRIRKYRGHDVSVIARHLFEGHTIVDWCGAETPYSLFWAVRSDGSLLSLTYAAGEQIEAWSLHTTAGRFESIASVTETDSTTGVTEDAVYVVVKRLCEGVPVRYIERFSSRVIPLLETVNDDLTSSFTQDVRTCNFLDCSLQYDGRNTFGLGIQSVVTTFAGGDQVTINSDGTNAGTPLGVNGFNSMSIGDTIILDPDGLALSFTLDSITSATSAQFIADQGVSNDPEAADYNPDAVAFLAHSTGSWAWGKKTITGLAHLNGQSVNALIDGAVAGPFTVAAGKITLGGPGCIVQVGIGYNSDLELLDLAADGVKSNVKTVTKAVFEVVSSRGLLCGETFDVPAGRTTPKLHAPALQKVSDGNNVPPLFTGQAVVAIGSSWNVGARMCLRQSDPLPLTVVAAIRDVILGGR